MWDNTLRLELLFSSISFDPSVPGGFLRGFPSRGNPLAACWEWGMEMCSCGEQGFGSGTSQRDPGV